MTSTLEAEREMNFNHGWRFALNAPESAREGDFDDSRWRLLDLPHDWIIEGSPDPDLEFWEGTGRIPGPGIGWYRKRFTVGDMADLSCMVVFDGVYNDADVWINGTHLGFHPNGYSPFVHDLTPHLRSNGENVLVVRVDHLAYADSRWYTGAGIYRNVSLVTTGKVHVPVWGVFVTTPEVGTERALVNAQIDVRNASHGNRAVELRTLVIGPDGRTVAQESERLDLGKLEERVLDASFPIPRPELWDTESPRMYTLVTVLLDGATVLDSTETRFGIRSFHFDPETGFFLNGRNLKIKGVCLHHDGGLVGSAVPKGVWRRRLELLREAGCNAIRSAHNPPSAEFLDLCDEMGFLVQNEFFDEWDNPKDKRYNKWELEVHPETEGYTRYFQEWAERDLKDTMRRDRNHPSIIQWSIGNEIEWTYSRMQDATGFFDKMTWQGNYFWSEPPFSPEEIRHRLETLPRGKHDIGETGAKLARWTREMDPTRPVTANCILPSSSHLTPYGESLDIVGYSYRRVLYDYGRKHYPDKVIMGTENVPQYHEWKAVMDRPHISGTFLWTGIRHMGELRGDWPVNTTVAGLLDLAGFRTFSWDMFRSLWQDEPHIGIATNLPEAIVYGGQQRYDITGDGEVVERNPGSWERLLWEWPPFNRHWNYDAGDRVVVEIYSNCEELELFLNDRSLGRKRLEDFPDHAYKWAVPFAEGTLLARGWKDGQLVESSLSTHGEPSQMEVNLDRTRLRAGSSDVAHVEVQLLDKAGNPVRTADRKLVFRVADGLKRLGVDNGSQKNVQTFQADTLVTAEGRALLIVQAGKEPGWYSIEVSGDGVGARKLLVKVDKS